MNKSVIESTSRRKAVKTIVGGVTALAAYNMMPVKWGTPIIGQIFLPAHAATSGEATVNIEGVWSFIDSDGSTGTITFNNDGTFTAAVEGDNDTGSYSVSGRTVTILNNSTTATDNRDLVGTLSSNGNTISSSDAADGYSATLTRQ